MAKMKTRKCRGRIINGYLKFVKKKWGKDGVDQCVKVVGKKLINIQDDRWYPVKLCDGIIHWIEDTHGVDAVRRSGSFTATNKGVVTFTARLMGIKKVLKQAEQEYRDNFDYGEITIKMSGNKARVIFTDVCPDETVCQAWLGAFQGILQMSKTPGIVTKKACQHKGGKSCIYQLKWS